MSNSAQVVAAVSDLAMAWRMFLRYTRFFLYGFAGSYVLIGFAVNWEGVPTAISRLIGHHKFEFIVLLSLPFFAGWIAVVRNYILNVRVHADRTISFPAAEVPNTFLQALTLRPYVGHLFRESLQLRDIQQMNNDTTMRAKQQLWALTISGKNFGSRQLLFTSKQKRDECRATLNVHVWGVRPFAGDIDYDQG